MVENLSGGQRYYFKVRAGNGCMPGDFSNEIAATPIGFAEQGLATGFKENVLGASTVKENRKEVLSAKQKPTITPASIIYQESNINAKETILIVAGLIILSGGIFALKTKFNPLKG